MVCGDESSILDLAAGRIANIIIEYNRSYFNRETPVVWNMPGGLELPIAFFDFKTSLDDLLYKNVLFAILDGDDELRVKPYDDGDFALLTDKIKSKISFYNNKLEELRATQDSLTRKNIEQRVDALQRQIANSQKKLQELQETLNRS